MLREQMHTHGLRMSKSKIKIGFTDYFNPIDEFFTDVLSQDFDIERDDANPDYLFFCDETFGHNNKNYDVNRVKKILFTGENRRPYTYQCHHAISFDHFDGPQFFRLPLWVVENWVNNKKLGWEEIWYFNRTMRAKDKEGFASFVVRNPGCEERNRIFQMLNSYKTVDSGGPLYNNIGGPLEQDGVNSHVVKTEFLKSRKFHIAYENSSYAGYTTEKILHGFLGHTIPIYWGSPTVEMDFNPKAFVSRHNFNTDEDMIRFVQLLDQNDELYDAMMAEPIFTSFQIMKHRNQFFDKFRLWFRTHVYMGER